MKNNAVSDDAWNYSTKLVMEVGPLEDAFQSLYPDLPMGRIFWIAHSILTDKRIALDKLD